MVQSCRCLYISLLSYTSTQLLLSSSQLLFKSSKDSLSSSIDAPSAKKHNSAAASATIVAGVAVTKSIMSSSSLVPSDATIDGVVLLGKNYGVH